jgi:membrane protein YdbS with pleckstrin-like domain
MEMNPVNPATIAVWRWQGVIATLLIVAMNLLVALRVPAWLGAALLALGIGLALSWFLPPIYFRRLRFGVDRTGIAIQHGVVWRSHTALPRSRIQHTDVTQGPLERRYGVATLKLYTAGSRFTKIELTGLAHGEALALRDALLAGNSASGV